MGKNDPIVSVATIKRISQISIVITTILFISYGIFLFGINIGSIVENLGILIAGPSGSSDEVIIALALTLSILYIAGVFIYISRNLTESIFDKGKK